MRVAVVAPPAGRARALVGLHAGAAAAAGGEQPAAELRATAVGAASGEQPAAELRATGMDAASGELPAADGPAALVMDVSGWSDEALEAAVVPGPRRRKLLERGAYAYGHAHPEEQKAAVASVALPGQRFVNAAKVWAAKAFKQDRVGRVPGHMMHCGR